MVSRPQRFVRSSPFPRSWPHLGGGGGPIIPIRQIPGAVLADDPEPRIRKINLAFEITRLPKETVDVPHRDAVGDTGTRPFKQGLEPRAANADLPGRHPAVEPRPRGPAVPRESSHYAGVAPSAR